MGHSAADGFVDDRSLRAELGIGDQGPEHVDDDPDAEERSDVGGIVGRRDLDDFDAAETFGCHLPTSRSTSRGRNPPGSGQPVPGTKPQSTQSIFEAHRDRIGILPSEFEGDLGGLVDAEFLDIAHGQHVGVARESALPPRAALASRRCRSAPG
jgi:hypothetical protein